MSRYLLCTLLTICLLACGCDTAKNLGKALGDLEQVRNELMRKFGNENVNVQAKIFESQTMIAVTYINSPLNQQTNEERAKRAQETAEIVRQHYPSIKNVKEIWVGFVRATTRLAIFHWSEMFEGYTFDSEARLLTLPRPDIPDPSKPSISYTASKNSTDISSSIIQLEGDTDNGVVVLPHFSVSGDVNKITPKPPEEVALDFAAYSEKPRFPNLTKLVFLSDNEITYQSKVQFSTSKIAGGMYSEFLLLKVPTTTFRKMFSGSVVKIKLNNKEYTLTEGQLLKIQRMSDYLR